MTIKARLRVQLHADTVLVAETEDDALWRAVLTAIQGGQSQLAPHPSHAAATLAERPSSGSIAALPERAGVQADASLEDDAVAKLAHELSVSSDALQGALGPEGTSPFLRLDVKSWEAFKKAHPVRGRNAISSAVVVSTLLCLWFKHGGLGRRPTQKEAHDVLAELGERDANASRSIKNCEWLQTRPDGLLINPAKYSSAVAVARAFILGTSVHA